MSLGLVFALSSAVFYGFASVVQSMAAQAEPAPKSGIDALLLFTLLRKWRFLLGLSLDAVGYATQFVAVRLLVPLFIVQVAVAGNLAVTAVAARRLTHTEVNRKSWYAIAAVVAGLAALGASAGSDTSKHAPQTFHIVVLTSAFTLGVLGLGLGRLPRRISVPGLALITGLEFALVAIATRVLTRLTPSGLLHDPATYALVLAGFGAFTFYASALQIGSVTTVTGIVVVSETVLPAVVGIALLGDRTHSGLWWLASAGFVVAVGGALSLARFAEVLPPRAHSSPPIHSDA